MAGIRKREWITKSGKKNACYEITYYLDGKQYRKSGFKTRIEAQKSLDKITKIHRKGILFKELYNEYITNHCELHCKFSTIDTYRKCEHYFKDLEIKIVNNLTTKDLELLLIKLKTQVSVSTLNFLITLFKTIIKYGNENNLCNNTNFIAFKKIKNKKHIAQFIDECDLSIFYQCIIEIADFLYPICYTALNTGMRKSELFGLNWIDINFSELTIDINKQLYRKKYTDPKTETSRRIIDIPVVLKNMLIEYKKEQKILYNTVFHKDGKPMNEGIINKYFKRIVKKFALVTGKERYNNLTFHSLRHTYASILLSKGVPPSYVQKQLGHSECTMTMNIYNHCMPEIKNVALDVLENIKYEHKKSINSENAIIAQL